MKNVTEVSNQIIPNANRLFIQFIVISFFPNYPNIQYANITNNNIPVLYSV